MIDDGARQCFWQKISDVIETGPKKSENDQRLTINKKSTIFELSSWNLVKMASPWGGPFDQLSW